MRGLFFAALFLTIISGTASAADDAPKASADASWTEYKKLLENYYFLDQQKAGHITCNLSVSQLQDYIDSARQKYGDKAIFDENLHDFSITYDRTKGVSFNSPHLTTRIRPGAQIQVDPVSAEKNLKEFDKRFNGVVSYLEDGISRIIINMNSPAPQNNLTLTKNGDITVVSFDDVVKGEHAMVTYSGTTQQMAMSSPNSSGTSTLDFQRLDGKLAVAHISSQMTQGSTKEKHTISISYQDLGPTFFPKQILEDAAEGTQQGNPWHVEIDFKDCKTSDVSP